MSKADPFTPPQTALSALQDLFGGFAERIQLNDDAQPNTAAVELSDLRKDPLIGVLGIGIVDRYRLNDSRHLLFFGHKIFEHLTFGH